VARSDSACHDELADEVVRAVPISVDVGVREFTPRGDCHVGKKSVAEEAAIGRSVQLLFD
jgi:hypothetical protein